MPESSFALIEGLPVVAHVKIFDQKEAASILERSTRSAVKWYLASSKSAGQGTPVPSRNWLMINKNVIDGSGTTTASWCTTLEDDDRTQRYRRRSAKEVMFDAQSILVRNSEPPLTCLINWGIESEEKWRTTWKPHMSVNRHALRHGNWKPCRNAWMSGWSGCSLLTIATYSMFQAIAWCIASSCNVSKEIWVWNDKNEYNRRIEQHAWVSWYVIKWLANGWISPDDPALIQSFISFARSGYQFPNRSDVMEFRSESWIK